MGKIALLVPREEMIYQAHNLLQEAGYQDKAFAVSCMKVVRTKNIVMEARQAIAGGASMIIARGLQASLIKQYTDIPVIEIVITAQEMALLVMKAKQILKKEHPVIAVVGFRNMFCDMSYFDGIYGIELRAFYAPDNEQLRAAALQAVEEKVDLLIGGDVAVEAAAGGGRSLPFPFYHGGFPAQRVFHGKKHQLCHGRGEEKGSPDGNPFGLLL